MIKRITLVVVVTCAALALLCTPSFADTTSLTLGTGNSALSGFAGPYAEVLVNRTSPTTATITFTSDIVGGNIYLMGDSGMVALNVNATTFTDSGFTGSNAGTGFTPGPFSVGSGTEDGFGAFNLTINDFDGFSSSVDTFSFDLTNTSGTWATALDVLTPNSSGFSAAAHIFVTSSPANASNGTLATGFAANGGAGSGPPVPEPASLLLLGSGLLFLSSTSKRFFRKA
jgi:hypothetical protein